MRYMYVRCSASQGGFYIGCAGDLKERVKLHMSGRVASSKDRPPSELVHYEACLDRSGADRSEKYIKTTYGRRYLKSRLGGYFTG
jgi:putative endonuclease